MIMKTMMMILQDDEEDYARCALNQKAIASDGGGGEEVGMCENTLEYSLKYSNRHGEDEDKVDDDVNSLTH